MKLGMKAHPVPNVIKYNIPACTIYNVCKIEKKVKKVFI